MLRRRALIIVAVTLLAGGAAAAFAYTAGDTYQSTAKLLFQQTIGAELNALGLLPGSPDADNLARDNAEIVSSRTVVEATARELQQGGSDLSADDVSEQVTVSTENDTDVVNILAEASSAEQAALLATTYAQVATDQADRAQRERSQRALVALRQQLGELTPGPDSRQRASRLRDDIQQLRAVTAVGPGRPQIIQRGYEPASASGNSLQTILLGLVFGSLLGVGLALVREQADRRLHREEDVSTAFDAPVLTTVPRSRALKRCVSFDQLPHEAAEAFRMLQMNLRYGWDEPVRSVLVTSTAPREGKTTVAWNLACAAAASGLSVALVEADMRRPELSSRYGLEPEPGLSEALRQEVSVIPSLQRVRVNAELAMGDGDMRFLQVLAAGERPHDPWALMQSRVMGRVLDVLKASHDLVVLDTPPIPHVADAISLLRRVDGVLVVASVNSTSGPEAGRLRDQLQSLDARVLGVVANGGTTSKGYAYAPASAPGTR